jgi:sugar transferase (PEP-CTERM system associated)
VIRLFNLSIPASLIALLVSETVLILSCYTLAAYWTVDAADVFLLDEGGMVSLCIVTAVIMAVLYFHDLYETYRIQSRIQLMQQFSMALGVAFLAQALFNYGRSTVLVMPKWTMMYGSLMALILVPSWRMLFSNVVMAAVGARKVLFLGSSVAVREIVGCLDGRPELGMAAVGYLDNEAVEPRDSWGTPYLGCMENLDQVITTRQPDVIVVGMKERRNHLPIERLLDLRFSGIEIEEASTTYEKVFHRVSTRDLRPSQLIFSAELGPRRSSITLQSIYSLALGIIGVIVTLPIMIVVAVLVKLTSRGPILFRQKRVGLNDVPFMVWKFRSMYENAEAKTGAIWATKDDPRITPLGRWLRRLRLDELPQLFNVLKGEMSIVGPRPERPEFVAALQEKMAYYRQRHCVKPGITGWAQINHKYGDTVEDALMKLEYDLYYIKNLAVSLDAYIVFHTAKTMLLGRGAQ